MKKDKNISLLHAHHLHRRGWATTAAWWEVTTSISLRASDHMGPLFSQKVSIGPLASDHKVPLFNERWTISVELYVTIFSACHTFIF